MMMQLLFIITFTKYPIVFRFQHGKLDRMHFICIRVQTIELVYLRSFLIWRSFFQIQNNFSNFKNFRLIPVFLYIFSYFLQLRSIAVQGFPFYTPTTHLVCFSSIVATTFSLSSCSFSFFVLLPFHASKSNFPRPLSY